MTLFTIRSPTEGRFGIGSIPAELAPQLDAIAREFLDGMTPEARTAATHHQWCRRLPPRLRAAVDAVRHHALWRQLADGPKAAVHDLDGMDEIYYSRAPRDRARLYGAAANYDLHVDGVFAFPGISVYRVLVGLTENEHVETQFPRLGVGHRIGKGEFVVFDFDRARHRVVRLADAPADGHRILLKLHYCVSTAGVLTAPYMWCVARAYGAYEVITRRVMDTGTDPRTPAQFAAGVLGQFAIRHPCCFRGCLAVPVVALLLSLVGLESVATQLFAVFALAVGVWGANACSHWLRYRLTGVR